MRKSATAALTAALCCVACAEPSAPTAVGSGVSFDFTNGPANPGPIIARTQEGIVVLFSFDSRRGLFAFHSTRNARPACGELVTITIPANLQRISNPADEILAMDLLRSQEHFVTVYRWAGEPITCAFTKGPRLAEGRAQFTLTDNDFFAFLRGEPVRADAFGWVSQGTLALTGGGLAHFNEVQRFVFFPPDDVRVSESINLKPIP